MTTKALAIAPELKPSKRHKFPFVVIPLSPEGLLPAQYMLRADLMERAGMSASELKSMIQRGKLRSRYRSSEGWVLYTLDDLRLCQRYMKERPAFHNPNNAPRTGRYTSEEGRAVFELLARGVDQVDIVIATRIHPAIVTEIATDYRQLRGGIAIPPALVDEINGLELVGVDLPIVNATQILNFFREAANPKLCSDCNRRPPSSVCLACHRARQQVLEKRKADEAARAALAALAAESALVAASEGAAESAASVTLADESAKNAAE